MDPTSAPSLIKRKDADLIERQRVGLERILVWPF